MGRTNTGMNWAHVTGLRSLYHACPLFVLHACRMLCGEPSRSVGSVGLIVPASHSLEPGSQALVISCKLDHSNIASHE